MKKYGFLIILFCLLPTVSAHAGQPVRVDGRQLLADFDQDGTYQPFLIKGAAYSDFPIGSFPSEWGTCWYAGMADNQPQFDCPGVHEFENEKIVDEDLRLIKDMNANVIRTYHKVSPLLLQKANDLNLKAIVGFWIPQNLDYVDGDLTKIRDEILGMVAQFKDDPAILAWAPGYQLETSLCKFPQATASCDSQGQAQALYRFLDGLAADIKKTEGPSAHPVIMVSADLGQIGKAAGDEAIPNVDVHGCNVLRGPEFGGEGNNFFDQYAKRSRKPLLIMEFGVDAWHVTDPRKPEDGVERQDIQADYLERSWDMIMEHSAGNGGANVGGIVFQYSDGWWKHNGEWKASAAIHDTDYVSNWRTGPDGFVNPEWFGITARALNPEKGQPDVIEPRLAYHVMKQKFLTQLQQKPWQTNQNGTLRRDMNWNYTMGYHFVPSKDGRITQLGGMFQGTRTVSLWETQTGRLLAGTPVESNNVWNYAAIDSVNVVKGKVYTVAVDSEGQGGSARFDIDPLPKIYGDVTITASTFAFGHKRPTRAIPQNMYGQVDVTLVTDTVGENQKPQITRALTAEPPRIAKNESTELSIEAADPDGETLSYQWFAPRGLIEAHGPQAKYFPPSVDRPTTICLTLLIADGRGGYVYDKVLVEVGPETSVVESPEILRSHDEK